MGRTKSKRIGSEGLMKTLLPLIALAILVVLNMRFTPNFATIELKDGRLFGAMIDILHRATPIMLLSIGMTLVIATKGIDLSVGAVMAICGAISAVLLVKGVSVPTVIIIGLVASCAAGLWNGILVSYFAIQPIVATLILMVAGRGLAQLITNGQIITFENPSFQYLGNGSLLMLPFTIFVVVAVFLVAQFLARKTVIGTYVEAVGGNEVASSYCGINSNSIKLFVYILSGLCAGVAGLIATSDIKAADPSRVGLNTELDAVLAVIIGGTSINGGKFNIIGSIIGALLIQTLTTSILMRGIDVEYTLVVKAITVILVCAVQSPSFRDFMKVRSSRRLSK